MLRAVAGVIVGYAVMVVITIIAFVVTGMVLGIEGIYKPASYEPSNAWVAMSLIAGLVAAILGGLVCVLIAGRRKPANALMIVVLVLGALSAVLTISKAPPTSEPRTPEVTMMEAAPKAQQPAWLAIAFPIVGVAGVLIGSKLKKDVRAA